MRTVLLGGLLLLLSSSCGGSGSNPLDPSNTSQFVGMWQNVDLQTRGLPQISIRTQGGTVYVHSWGSCVPTYCDWGEVAATSTSGVLQAVYNLSIEVDTQTLTLSNGQLQSAVHEHFIDGSGRADFDFTDVFNKAS
jgi:hypothetical protein